MDRKSRWRLWRLVTHWVDGLLLSLLAGCIVAVSLNGGIGSGVTSGVLGSLGRGPMWLSLCAAFLMPLFVAALAPRSFRSAVAGLLRLPWHCGLLVKSGVALLALALVMWLMSGDPQSFWLPLSACVVLALGLVMGWLLTDPLRSKPRDNNAAATRFRMPEGVNTETRPDDIQQWLLTDEPVRRRDESRIPEHLPTTEQILQNLMVEADPVSGCLPSIALVGEFGSGKTSICNLVSDLYRERERVHRYGRVLFCRFEAWQYSSPEAALRGLLDAITSVLEEHVDDPGLWRMGERYVELAKESGSAWAKLTSILLSAEKSPRELMDKIGDVLVRIGARVILFVDDLDRIETFEQTTRQALVHALNQLQAMPNLQYVLALTPSCTTLDMAKLVRFREVVPSLYATAPRLAEQLRQNACDDVSAEVRNTLHPWLRKVPGREQEDCGGLLVRLLTTPRLLKAALRYTNAAWKHGLCGEVDWYDLLMFNTLRAACPNVYDWVVHAPVLFAGRGSASTGAGTDEKSAERLTANLECLVARSGREPDEHRKEAVIELMGSLFPAFARSALLPVRGEQSHGHFTQRLCEDGGDYLVRVIAGRVPDDQVADRPTLIFLSQVNNQGIHAASLAEHLNGPDWAKRAEKVAKFAWLLREGTATGRLYEFCSAAFQIAASPGMINVPEDVKLRIPGKLISCILSALYRRCVHSDVNVWAEGLVAQRTPLTTSLLSGLVSELASPQMEAPLSLADADRLLRSLPATQDTQQQSK